jgi:hypothetical protein
MYYNLYMNKIIIYYIFITIILFGFLSSIYLRPPDNIVDPELYMNKNLTEAQKLKVKIHSTHHHSKDVEELVKKLENGESWETAHTVLKPMPFNHHIKHIDVEMMTLFIQSLTLTTGLLFAYSIQSTFDYLKPSDPKLTIWYNFICFIITVIMFATFIMISKHYLSFRTFNETLFF